MLSLGRTSCLGEAFDDAINAYKSDTALIEAERHRENGRWTFAELGEQARGFGGVLAQRGVEPQSRVAILMQNQARWLISAVGAFWRGAVVVPLDYKLSAAEQLGLLDCCQPRVLVTEYPLWRALLEQAGPERFERMTVVVSGAPPDVELGPALPWSCDGPQADRCDRARDDIACIVYSSGTGGTPRGCQLTHENYLVQAELLARLFPPETGDRYFSVLPTNHAIDFMCGFVLPLLCGTAVVHQRALRPQYLTWTMKRYGITQMALVPSILETLERRLRERIDGLDGWQRIAVDALSGLNALATQRRPRHGLSQRLLRPIHRELGGRLRLVFCGGAFVDRDVAERLYRLGLPVVIGYGLTEACTVATVNDLRPFRADSVGRALDGIEVEVRDADEQGVGEVWLRGPTVMAGYLDEPELTAQTLVDGWLRTGDVGSLDASYHLKLVGRRKNMVVTSGGKNVYPEDVEALVGAIDGCSEQCVFAADYVWPAGAQRTEQLVIVLCTDGEADIEQLRARNRALPPLKRLGGYVLWQQPFPRTASQKVKRQALAEQLRAVGRDPLFRPL